MTRRALTFCEVCLDAVEAGWTDDAEEALYLVRSSVNGEPVFVPVCARHQVAAVRVRRKYGLGATEPIQAPEVH